MKSVMNFLSMFVVSATTLSGYAVVTNSTDVKAICKTVR